MGLDYALVHLQYTIPPAILLTLSYRPLLTRLDVYKICFLVTIAVVSTIPWDSYLIHQRIWSYPAHVVAGPTLFKIPAEELFFFVIQTYNTTLLYLFLSKPLLHPAYLVATRPGRYPGRRLKWQRTAGQVVLVGLIGWGVVRVVEGKQATYMGLILVWAGPFLLLLWSLAYQFVLRLPLTSTLWPVLVPTLYLWIVDTLALKRGTWVIESGTKLGIHVWDGLEIEEAVFFLATNMLIVFGLVAFDNAMAILVAFPALFPDLAALPTPTVLVRALLTSSDSYDAGRLAGIVEALVRLRAKSRSFYLASACFQGRLRIDLILLYSFARVADDLVDNAKTLAESTANCEKLRTYLDICYGSDNPFKLPLFINDNFTPSVRNALRLLPTNYLSSEPLYELLEGFRTDLEFDPRNSSKKTWPIRTETDLDQYAMRVAGTVAELCLELVFHHYPGTVPREQRLRLVHAGGQMGVALQCVNIARDIAVDAQIGRVYFPTSWVHTQNLEPEHFLLAQPDKASLTLLKERMLAKAEGIYAKARPAIDGLPRVTRGPMAVAVESYMEIGRVLAEGEGGYTVIAGRATVPKMRRLRVAWKALTNVSSKP